MGEPLSGVKVVELHAGIAAATAGMWLADAGARVIKLEPREGDASRRDPGNRVWNRSKESCVWPEGDERRARLLADADVLLVGGGRVEHGGEPPAPHHTAQIVCTAPPYADAHPYAALPESESLAAALSGVLGGTGTYRGGPGFPVVPMLSYTVGVLMATGTAAALRVRAATGLGQTVEVPWPTIGSYLSAYQASACENVRVNASAGGASPLGLHSGWRFYRAKDGWITVACPTPAFYDKLLIAVGRPEVATDSRFATAPFVAPDLSDELVDIVSGAIATKSQEEWAELFEAFGVPAARVMTRAEFAVSDLVAENAMRVQVQDPEVGEVQQIASPLRMASAPPVPPRPAPAIGAHDASAAASAAAVAPFGNAAAPAHPLAGTRVLDFTGYLAGPTAGRLLAELGADVIKVEPPAGEGLRAGGLTCVGINTGKRGLAFDSSSEAGAELRDRLLRSADVVLQAMLPGAPEKLGIDEARVRALNPRIVYASIQGFGQAQRWRARPSFDLLLQALSGQLLALGSEEAPVYSSIPMADLYAGTALVFGIVLALAERDRSGEGTAITTNQVAASLAAQAGEFVSYAGMPEGPKVTADSLGSGALHRYYSLRDGWAILAIEDARSFERLVEVSPAIGEWTWEEALNEPLEGRLALQLGDWLGTLSRSDVERDLIAAGVAIAPVVIVRDEGIDNPCFAALGALTRTPPHPSFGTVTTVGPFLQFSRTPVVETTFAQWIGEHNAEILESLGYTEAQVDALARAGVIAEKVFR